jgi:hypothetical protein
MPRIMTTRMINGIVDLEEDGIPFNNMYFCSYRSDAVFFGLILRMRK